MFNHIERKEYSNKVYKLNEKCKRQSEKIKIFYFDSKFFKFDKK